VSCRSGLGRRTSQAVRGIGSRARTRPRWPSNVKLRKIGAGRSGARRTLCEQEALQALAGSASENTVRVLRVDCGTRAELAKVIRRAPCTAACDEDEVLVTAYCGPRRRAVTFVNERSVSCIWGVTSPLVAVCAKITPQ